MFVDEHKRGADVVLIPATCPNALGEKFCSAQVALLADKSQARNNRPSFPELKSVCLGRG
jgi:hypothetical protein